MSFDVALSGLNAAQADLNVISHNIANASTTGFKSSRSEFADVYAVTQTGLSRNAIGRGVNLKSVNQAFTQGGISFTQNNLDLAVSGQGFFRVSDTGSTAYTRAGHFGIDRDGYIVNSSSQRLQGYQAAGGVLGGTIGDLQVDFSDFPPQASSQVVIGANLDSTAPIPTAPFSVSDSASYNDSTSTTVYDSLGSSHVLTSYYRKTADNAWQAHVYLDNTAMSGPGGIAMTFDAQGTLTAGSLSALGPTAVTGGAAPMSLTLDQNTVTQFGSVFGVNKLSQDGYPTGRLSDLDIDQNGNISARFTNGSASIMGQVVLANFQNPQGLQQMGDTAWVETFSSGVPLVGTPGSTSLGLIESGAIEESNVDLTAELVKMITAQRNYQANAEVISTADTITQTIINIR